MTQREKSVEAAQRTIETALGSKDHLLVGWYIIAEFIDTNGDRDLVRLESDGATEWQLEGYLNYSLEHMNDEAEA